MRHIIAATIAGLVSLGIVLTVHLYGHSTPGIWAMLLGLPGVLLSIWIVSGDNNGFFTYFVMAVVNWAVYFGVIEGLVALQHRFSK